MIVKNIAKDISGVILYFFIAFIVCSVVTTMIFFLMYLNDIYYLHSTDSSFHIIKFILYKMQVIVFYFIPINLIAAVVGGFSIVKNLNLRLLGSYFAFIIFVCTIFILIYLIFFVHQNRIAIMDNAYIPKQNKQFSNVYNNSLASFDGIYIYFSGNTAIYYKNGFIGKSYYIDLKNNKIVLQNDLQNEQRFEYIPYPESVSVLKFLKPIQLKYKRDFLVFMQLVESRPMPLYFVYLFSLLCALSLLPSLLYKKSWNFSAFAFKIILTTVYIALLALSYQYMRRYLSDLRLKYSLLFYFPAFVMFLITLIEIIIVIVKQQKIHFFGLLKQITNVNRASTKKPYGEL